MCLYPNNNLVNRTKGIAHLVHISKRCVMFNVQLNLFREIIVDNFAGGGGASTGIEMATGLSVDIAINHDPAAIAMHKANHPDTEHYCESVWEVDPREAVKGRPVGLAWFSPDCKHFSKAKGGKPVNKEIRGLAWVAVRWAATVRPRVIMLENVEEFKTWGPVGKDGQPIKEKQGETFNSFVGSLKKLGYEVEFKELRACDFGAPTSEKDSSWLPEGMAGQSCGQNLHTVTQRVWGLSKAAS
jgi:DNA (cytosine-5)-methyltransferase 1